MCLKFSKSINHKTDFLLSIRILTARDHFQSLREKKLPKAPCTIYIIRKPNERGYIIDIIAPGKTATEEQRGVRGLLNL